MAVPRHWTSTDVSKRNTLDSISNDVDIEEVLNLEVVYLEVVNKDRNKKRVAVWIEIIEVKEENNDILQTKVDVLI